MKVFISHQKADRDQAKKIAEYLKSVNIDVYFDEFDRALQDADRVNNPNKVVEAIRQGVRSSFHMLCLVSPSTLQSKWVPFEVGYGYDNTVLSVLTLKSISNSNLPAYLQVATIIRDIYDINKFVKVHGSHKLFESKSYSDYKSYSHPLSNIMDSIIS